MTSKIERGIAKNLANFEKLIAICTSFGKTFNPARPSLKLPQLLTLYTKANLMLQDVRMAEQKRDVEVDKRKGAFSGVKKLGTRIIDSLKATDASKETIDNAKGHQRKLQGTRASALPLELNSEGQLVPANTRSTSQQSFDMKIDSLAKLIVTASGEPSYLPNEADLKFTGLNAMLSNLKLLNTNAVNAKIALSNTLIARDQIMDAPITGLVDTALAVKSYVRSVYGSKSREYLLVRSLSFTRYRR